MSNILNELSSDRFATDIRSSFKRCLVVVILLWSSAIVRSSLTDNFCRLRLNDRFVDKSLLIADFLNLTNKPVIAITRPKGWGKSTNLNMIARFFEIGRTNGSDSCARQLFFGGKVEHAGRSKVLDALKISRLTEFHSHFAAHPIIFIDLSNVTGADGKEIEGKMLELIGTVYDEYGYIVGRLNKYKVEIFDRYRARKVDRGQLQDSLWFLSDSLYDYFRRKPYILIDNFDVPVIRTFDHLYRKFHEECKECTAIELTNRTVHSKTYREVYDFFWLFFQVSLKSNSGFDRAIITGTYNVKFSHNFRGLDTLVAYTVSDKYFSRHYGFYDDELTSGCGTGGKPATEKLAAECGYKVDGETIYRPSSVRRRDNATSPDAGLLRSFFTDHLLDSSVAEGGVAEFAMQLIESPADSGPTGNISEQIDLERIVPDFSVSYLLQAGYVTCNRGYGRLNVSVPNDAIRNLLKSKLVAAVLNEFNITGDQLNAISRSLVSMETRRLEASVRTILPESVPQMILPPFSYERLIKCSLYPLESNYTVLRHNLNDSNGLIAGAKSMQFIPKSNETDAAIIVAYKILEDEQHLKEIPFGLRYVNEIIREIRRDRYPHVKRFFKFFLAIYNGHPDLQYEDIEL